MTGLTSDDVDAFYFGQMSVVFRAPEGRHVIAMMERLPNHPMRVLRFRALDKPKKVLRDFPMPRAEIETILHSLIFAH